MTKHDRQTYVFHVSGMHCASCALLIERALEGSAEIDKARVSLGEERVEISGAFGDKGAERLAAHLTGLVQEHGYAFSVGERQAAQKRDLSEFRTALPIAMGLIALFIVLQKMDIVRLLDVSDVSYGAAFLIGVVASLSTCMAVVGGVVLSLSTAFARKGERVRPQVLFHVGRVVAFFVLGGAIGVIGKAFTLNTFSTFMLGIVIGGVMLFLGLDLLDIFPWTKRMKLTMPKVLSRQALSASTFTNTYTPLLVGIATFFLPCGFTQAMQIYTLSTGDFWEGGLTMLAFALGTLPILALVSFSSFSIRENARAGIFFKTAGLVIIAFALFNIMNSLVAIGFLPPLFTL